MKKSFAVQTDWMTSNPDRASSTTGNAAFDAFRETELARLEEERAKLDAMRKDFDDHLESLRLARDQEEFDRFMSKHKKK